MKSLIETARTLNFELLDEAKKLKVGQEVTYKGKWARVEEIDGNEVTVSDEDGEEYTIDKDQVK